MAKQKVFLIVQNKFKKLNFASLDNDEFNSISNHEESPKFLKSIIETFSSEYEIHPKAWSDLLENSLYSSDIIIIPPWYITGKGSRKLDANGKQKVRNIMRNLPYQGIHIISLTRSLNFWDQLDNYLYRGNKVGFVRSSIDKIRILNYDSILTNGVKNLLNSNYGKDFFGVKVGNGQNFNTLISKIPDNNKLQEFNLFGYANFHQRGYLFYLDIANAGSNYSHKVLFEQLLTNIITFLKQHNL